MTLFSISWFIKTPSKWYTMSRTTRRDNITPTKSRRQNEGVKERSVALEERFTQLKKENYFTTPHNNTCNGTKLLYTIIQEYSFPCGKGSSQSSTTNKPLYTTKNHAVVK
jgi:hypothetical protein